MGNARRLMDGAMGLLARLTTPAAARKRATRKRLDLVVTRLGVEPRTY